VSVSYEGFCSKELVCPILLIVEKSFGISAVILLEFSIDIILPVALWPWESTQPLTEMSTRFISLEVKVASS